MRIAIYTDHLPVVTSDTRYVHDGLVDHFQVSVYREPRVDLCADDDVVFYRFKLPVREGFLRALAPLRHDKLFVNDPVGLLELQSKRHLLRFPDLIPPTVLTESLAEIRDFADEHGAVVVKPQDRHKGVGTARIAPEALRAPAMAGQLRSFVEEYGTPVVQKYVPEIETEGCKRINTFGYRPVSVEVGVPAPGEFIVLSRLGASFRAGEVEARDERVLARVTPVLEEHGIYWAGIDLIGPYLGELNVVQPNTLRETDQLHGDGRGLRAVVETLEAHTASPAS